MIRSIAPLYLHCQSFFRRFFAKKLRGKTTRSMVNLTECFSAILSTEAMASDDDDQRPRPDPFTRGFGGVEIVNCAAGGIPAVQRILRGAVGASRDGLVELAVIDTGEGAVLIDDAGDGIREGRMAHTVEHHGADGDLAGIGLSPRLGGDQAREQIELRASGRRCRGYAEGGQCLRAALAVDGQAVLFLKRSNRFFRAAAVYAVDRAGIITPLLESGLDLADGLSAAAALYARSVGGGERDEHDGGDREDQSEDGSGSADAGVFHRTILLLIQFWNSM